MTMHDNEGTQDRDDTGQMDVISASKDRCLVVRGTDRRRKEKAVLDNENATLSREKSVTAREKAVNVREQSIREITSAQTASDEYKRMLQHVNERLVIATIEAQKLAEQLQLTKDQMEIAKAGAEKANRAKSEFLSSMSHELRTPLNAILGFAQLLEAGTPLPTPSQKLRLNEIIKAGWYLLGLINEVLDFSLIESGKVTLLIESVVLVDVLRECMAMIEPQAQQHGIKLILHSIDNTWLAKADRIRVKQVLLNLLSNAVKYNSQQGTIEIACTLTTEACIRISVKDEGAGLSPEQIAQLFQSFNRLGQEASDKEGTGIGLVVSKHLVELMDGNIGVNSTVGVGSEFWIELPTPQGDDSATIASVPITDIQNNPALSTVLYIEDNLTNTLLVEHIITDLSHLRLVCAPDGQQGLMIAKTERPTIILMDITLPDISGMDVLKMLKLDPNTAPIPIIALSANALPSDIRQGLEMGFFHYLTKPIKINELIDTLNEALDFSKITNADTPKTDKHYD